MSTLNDQYSFSVTNNVRCNFPFKIISNFALGANIADSSMLNVNAQPFVPATIMCLIVIGAAVRKIGIILFNLKLNHWLI